MSEHKDLIAYMGLRANGDHYSCQFAMVNDWRDDLANVPETLPPEKILRLDDKTINSFSIRAIGAVFPVTFTEKGISYHKESKHVGFVGDTTRFAWQSCHLTASKLQDAKKATDKEAKRDLIAEQCELLARGYQRQRTGPARAQYIARVVFLITRGDR